MGGCFSKKKASSSHHNSQPQAAALPISSALAPLAAETSLKTGSEPKIYKVDEEEQVENASQQEESFVKKEIFVIKHRKSHDRDRRSPPPQNAPHSAENESASSASASASAEGGICNINTAVRTSSCTKEEVDAILIQCGRLSRSNSSGKTLSSSKKYSGSKRSYDFDNENDNDIGVASTDYGSRKKGNDGLCEDDRPRHRQSSRSSSQGRRRTPSREREPHQQRSGSRERGSSSGGRRVSRSPGRRSENTHATLVSNGANNATNRPGKIVSVPATVSSLVIDKSSNGLEAATTTTANSIKRISVKRNVGVGEAAVGVGSRTAASPRSQSPARTNPNANNVKGCNENQQQNQQQPTLSRSSSRKAEHSPYRRNPLSEIDPNSLAYPQSAANKNSCCINKGQGGMKESTNVITQKSNVVQGSNHKAGSIGTVDNMVVNVNTTTMEPRMAEEVKTQPSNAGAEILKPQSLTRSRSSRRSRDLDLNPETLSNPIPSSYTTLLLEDIQNFHQTNNPPSFSLPPCVSKACSILEAVADLNSTTSSNLSNAFSEDRKGLSTDESNKNRYNITVGRKMTETRDPFVESEVIGSDDLMEPSFHKYVTVRRGGVDTEEQESSGSNSFVGNGQQHWGFSSSSWEPNSADSTDRWTSRTKGREEDYSVPLGLQRRALAESGSDIKNSTRKGLTGSRQSDNQHAGGKTRAGTGLHSIPFAAAAAST
ncbi:uncharacterized protein At1g65710 [Durio zibethinus]|uniref:Uncharacterized protein At1g65710 n=1 Tax=Durio zibethinus TaxID=66656 RepID=A0A6P6A5B3_DURZI|nr:uncharacterized protein At1g65710 [Durio zibethinus]